MKWFFAALIEWLIGENCLFCGKNLSTFSSFTLCFRCLRSLVDEFIFLDFYVDGFKVFALGEYSGFIKEWIYWVKFRNSMTASYVLTKVVTKAFMGRLGQFEVQGEEGTIIRPSSIFDDLSHSLFVGVPCSLKSKRQRGWDPVSLLIKTWKKDFGIQTVNFICRNRKGYIRGQQKKLNKEERLQASKKRFVINERRFKRWQDKNRALEIKRIILVDDVYTTGSTLMALKALLEQKEAFRNCEFKAYVICCD